MKHSLLPLLLAFFYLAGCASSMPQVAVPQTAEPLPSPELPATTTILPSHPAPSVVAKQLPPTSLAIATPSLPPTLENTPVATSQPTVEVITPLPTEPAAFKTARELAEVIPPVRDDWRLATAYRKLVGEPEPLEAVTPTAQPALGQQESFSVLDINHNSYGEITARLRAQSEHAYFWFEVSPHAQVPSEPDLDAVAEIFDTIYEEVTAHYGMESNPGIDGDPRLHVLHVSPETLCGLRRDPQAGCGTAGLVNSTDLLPRSVDPRSNEREMFVMNDSYFGSSYYLSVLAHEFRHMIEDNYDKAETDWGKEGSAMLAPELAGLAGGGPERGNLFLANPDQQLNSWPDENTGPYYGQGYLLNRYLFHRLGEDGYRDFATSSLPGLQAVDALAAEHDLEFDGQMLWLDWLVALAVHDDLRAPERYQMPGPAIDTARREPLESLPARLEGEVRQYAADYYELPGGPLTITFEGDGEARLLEAQPPANGGFWFAQRANYSNPRLTRRVDLRGVPEATLIYDVYVDIEQGYDFAYVSVSPDDGRTWLPLASEQMQGQTAEDNPAGSALAERFYTGRRREWVHESIDLSPFAGQEFLLRFEYVTDPILTFEGLALQNIAIPEIGFSDQAGTDSNGAWENEGFVWATWLIPQAWHLQLITFGEDGIQVERLSPSGGEAQSLTLDGQEDRRNPILIVAATSPATLQSATYQLAIERQP